MIENSVRVQPDKNVPLLLIKPEQRQRDLQPVGFNCVIQAKIADCLAKQVFLDVALPEGVKGVAEES